MTPEVMELFRKQRWKLTGQVIEIGSLDVNGSVRSVIDVTVGTDIRPGKGVDLVCPVQELLEHFEPESFDACVSSETLEHVEDWKGFITTTWSLVKSSGYLVMTMASKYKKRHAYPDDYWRFEIEDIRRIYPMAEWIGEIVTGKNKVVSIGWIVQKSGELGSLDFEPMRVT